MPCERPLGLRGDSIADRPLLAPTGQPSIAQGIALGHGFQPTERDPHYLPPKGRRPDRQNVGLANGVTLYPGPSMWCPPTAGRQAKSASSQGPDFFSKNRSRQNETFVHHRGLI